MNEAFLPVAREECVERGWDRPDFVYVIGDAYVDHPSFGPAIISRVLEKNGYKVAILAQPDWRNIQNFKVFGRPRLAFLVSSGNIDPMVNHYTAAHKRRSTDAYSPGGKIGMWLVSGIAFLTSLFAIITGFIPTPGVREKGTAYVLGYIAFLLIGTVVFIIIPLWLYKHSQKHRQDSAKQN